MGRYVIARAFDDFDDLRETIHAWDLDLRQLDRGPFEGQLLQVGGERLRIAHARFGRAMEQRGSPPQGFWTFAVPSVRCPPFRWRNHHIAAGQIPVFRPGSDLDAVSMPGFEVFTLSIPEEDLPEAFDRSDVMDVAPESLKLLRRRLSEFVRDAILGTGSPEQEVLAALRACLSGARGSSEGRKAGRHRLMNRAGEYLSEQIREPVTVTELCRVLSVNERTLRRAFRDRFGISPKAYLTALRLNGARRDLRAGTPRSALVSEIARAWGFRHPGQFSIQYAAQFGKSPSETLRRPACQAQSPTP